MNTDSLFLLHEELRSKLIRLRSSHLTATSRYETAKARLRETESLYLEAEASYKAREQKRRDELHTKVNSSPGFHLAFATNIVTRLQSQLQQGVTKLNEAELHLRDSEVGLATAQKLLHSATDVLTFAFAEKNASVPHVVEQAILPIARSLSEHEYECLTTRNDVKTAKHVVEQRQNCVFLYQQDLHRAEEEQKERVDSKICRKRKQAGHEDMMTAAREAMTSAEKKVKEILQRIHSVELELHSLKFS